MDGTRNEEETVFRGVRVPKTQDTWLRENAINFSELVRRLLDDEIARREGKLAEASA